MVLPQAPNNIKWYHTVLSTPMRALAALNVGALGGEYSLSAVVGALIAAQHEQEIDYPLSKTETFYVKQLKGRPLPDSMMEYGELNFAVQAEIVKRWGSKPLGVIWVGGDVFSPEYPLLAQRKPVDRHVWIDERPNVFKAVRPMFDEIRQSAPNLPTAFTLPDGVAKLNECVDFLAEEGVQHVVIQGYGYFFTLTTDQNYAWLSQLHRPANVELSFVFNAPGVMPFVPAVMEAFRKRKIISYQKEHIAALFQKALPGSEIAWTLPKEETRGKTWSTWIVFAPPKA
jgi:hypothetical protein